MVIFWPPEFSTLTQPGRIDTLVCNDSMFLSRISWKVSLRVHILPLWLSQAVKIACVVFTDFTQLSSSKYVNDCTYVLEQEVFSVLLYLLTAVLISQTSSLQWAINYHAKHLKLLQNSFPPHYETQKIHQHGSVLGLICSSEGQLSVSAHCWTQPFTQGYVT